MELCFVLKLLFFVSVCACMCVCVIRKKLVDFLRTNITTVWNNSFIMNMVLLALLFVHFVPTTRLYTQLARLNTAPFLKSRFLATPIHI